MEKRSKSRRAAQIISGIGFITALVNLLYHFFTERTLGVASYAVMLLFLFPIVDRVKRQKNIKFKGLSTLEKERLFFL